MTCAFLQIDVQEAATCPGAFAEQDCACAMSTPQNTSAKADSSTESKRQSASEAIQFRPHPALRRIFHLAPSEDREAAKHGHLQNLSAI